MSVHPALNPVRLAGTTIANRAVVAPMSRVSTGGDGVATAEMADYYAEFARGGFGLVITEGTYTDSAHSQAYPDQPGIVTAEQVAAWRRVTDAVHACGSPIVLQLMHAGALSQTLDRTIAPSAVAPKGQKMPAYGGRGPFPLPAAATAAQLRELVDGFAASAVRARDAGFDGVELHGANGYLLDQFLTTYTNHRDDEYGGDVTGRTRLPVEVLRAVRAATGPGFTVGIRLSQTKVNDLAYRWSGVAEASGILRAFGEADYLHLASEGRDWLETAVLDGGVTVTALARQVTGRPVIANGGMHDPARAESVLTGGHADLVALARGALANPDWPRRLAEHRPPAEFDPATLKPDVTLPARRPAA
ncbi:NADH:flavin oxidoreductase [Saccharopolyspora taberi]|uniref:NADH:flavin oxidoreductase n=1 Tax=Saccharopolyspora taberi TaxID=60895 RepID=A0ABN3VD30_9PSEU